MSNKKQTAVDYLYEKMFIHRGNITIDEYEKANEIEKQQIMDAFNKCSQKFFCPIEAEQYYKETYEK